MLRLIEQAKVEEGADPEEVASVINTKRYEVCDQGDFKAAMAVLLELPAGVVIDDTANVAADVTCSRRLNIDPPCRFNIDPGRVAAV
jgi:hypothetical protein